MRISIREQLGLLVLFCSLLALMVLALATWFQSKNFVTSIRLSGLSLTASLKAAQVSSTLTLYESQVRSISTRILIQSALARYENGNNTAQNWVNTQADLQSALSNGNLLTQAKLFPANNTGNATEMGGLVNATSNNLQNSIMLPFAAADGGPVYLGDSGFGYPPELYPNLTYGPDSVSYKGVILDPGGILFLGPLAVNDTYGLMSATTAVINNTSQSQILGWLTIAVDVSMLFDIRNSQEGLGNSGEVLIVGPANDYNLFYPVNREDVSVKNVNGQEMEFILPLDANISVSSRHSQRVWPNNSAAPFQISSYPAVLDAWTVDYRTVNNAGAVISTHNEQNMKVSAGFAQVSTTLVDWVLVVEEDYGEIVAPINHLRDVVLICVFCTMAGLIIFAFPLAHYSVTPIRQLRSATKKTVEPYQPDDGTSGFTGSSVHSPERGAEDVDADVARKEGFMNMFNGLTGRYGQDPNTVSTRRRRRRTFRIPSKVPERKHWITDELTDLTSTFNEMSDELAMQYQRLDERVKERTAQLELSKQEAEAANRSKTLFIANISHELKTPLNGILGLTTVCMNEDDPSKIRSTLNTIYKSGDLLLHLLTDLLTFSKNEVGQQLSIDESDFRVVDLSTQLIPTFEKQAREGQINLSVHYFGSNDAFGTDTETPLDDGYGPVGTGRVKDMCLWGDKNRILQVLMNFVSNSLKFTPPQGSVTVRIKCLGIMEPKAARPENERKSSMRSQGSKTSVKKKVRTSDTSLVLPNEKTRNSMSNESKLSINVAGGTTHIAKVVERRRSKSPPPINTKDLEFEFEVEDTGPGIPEDQQKKIFEPFVQGDLGLSRKYGGTGLGLSICAQLASLMGGNLSLHSEVGVGSKFSMRLPLRYTSVRAASMASTHRTLSKASSVVGRELEDESAPTTLTKSEEEMMQNDIPRIVGFTQPYVAKQVHPDPSSIKINAMRQAEKEAAKDGRKVKVLVAEDNKINQEVVLRMLKLEEIYDVTIAKDGQEAFDKVRESMETGNRFHLVFMDVQMPNLDGIQSTKLIRGMGFSAPIVALTAFAEKSNEDECMASGMDYFLAKPIKRPALKHVLKKYCTTIVEEDYDVTPISKTENLKMNGTPKGPALKEVNGVEKHKEDSRDVSPMS